MKLTETTVEELHAAVQTTRNHRFDVFVSVAADEQRSIFDFIFRTSLLFQLLLLFPASFTSTSRYLWRSNQPVNTCWNIPTLMLSPEAYFLYHSISNHLGQCKSYNLRLGKAAVTCTIEAYTVF